MTAGVVLVGGRSARMGRDKCDIETDGRRWAEIVAAALLDGGCEPVATVGAEWFTPIDGVAHILDSRPGDGPLPALIDALRWAAPRDVVVVPTDLPLLTSGGIARLLDRSCDVSTLVERGGRLALPSGRWAADVLGVAEQCYREGGRSLHAIVDRIEHHTVDPGRGFDDVDTPEALR